ncbi:hypothetical protein LCGC14_3012860, partial [marine sediment metagenome]
LNSTLNPIIFDNIFFQDCSNCVFNFSFSGDAITIKGLAIDFLGSWNYSIVARSGSLIKEFFAQIYYSDFNVSLPTGVFYYNVFVPSNNISNVTPYKQSKEQPIWNISNLAYDESIDIYAKINESLDACLNITFSNSSFIFRDIINESFTWLNDTELQLDRLNIQNLSEVVFNQTSGNKINSTNYTMDYDAGTITLTSNYGNNQQFGINYSYEEYNYNLDQDYSFRLNTNYQKILHNISSDEKGIWAWEDYHSCTNRFFDDVYQYFGVLCSDCYFEESQLDNYNVIIG